MTIAAFLILFDEEVCSYHNNHPRRFYSRTIVLQIQLNHLSHGLYDILNVPVEIISLIEN